MKETLELDLEGYIKLGRLMSKLLRKIEDKSFKSRRRDRNLQWLKQNLEAVLLDVEDTMRYDFPNCGNEDKRILDKFYGRISLSTPPVPRSKKEIERSNYDYLDDDD